MKKMHRSPSDMGTETWIAAVVVAVAILYFMGTFQQLFAPPAPKPGVITTPIPVAATPIPTLAPDWSKFPDLMERLQQYQTNPYADSQRQCDLPPQVFAKLPPFPKDFYANKLLFQLGKVYDANYFSEAYWKQPEFYPQFEEQGCQMHQYPPKDRWAAVGYGTFPSEVVVLSKRTDEFEANFFMYTSWLVQTYQGMGFSVEYPSSGELVMSQFPDNSRTVQVDPAETRKYFEVEVTPEDVLLEPAFPVFEPNWTQKVTVKVKAKNAKPGRYLIGVNLGPPSKEKGTEWLYKYKLNYIGTGGQTIGHPWFVLFIEVQ